MEKYALLWFVLALMTALWMLVKDAELNDEDNDATT